MKKTLKDIIVEEIEKLKKSQLDETYEVGDYKLDPPEYDDEPELSADELWNLHQEAENDLYDDVEKELLPIHPHKGDMNIGVYDTIHNDISWFYDKGPEIYKSPEKIAEIMMQEDSEADGLGVRPAEEYKLFANKMLPFFEKYEHVQNLFDDWKEKDDQENRRHRRRLREGKEDQKPLAESVNKRLLKLAGIK